MRGPLKIAAVVLLSFSLGLHWAALQSVAWTTMLIQRAQSGTLAEAIETTFDGKHPCMLCLVVKDGRASEREQSATPANTPTSILKLELCLWATPVSWSPRPGLERGAASEGLGFRTRPETPPLPPPRLA